MNAQSIILTCKEYTDRKIKECKKVYGVVTSISGGVFVKASWNDLAWDVPIKKYKHVTVAVGDLVAMESYNGSYIIVGVIEA